MNIRSAAWHFLLLIPGSLSGAHAAPGEGYTIHSFNVPGYDRTGFYGINNSGHIVGSVANADHTVETGFVYSGGTYQFLTGPAGAALSFAMDISDTGVVVGGYGVSPTSELKAFIYEGGSYSEFEIAGALRINLRGISPDGRYLSGAYSPDVQWRAFVFDRVTNNLTDVGLGAFAQGINSYGAVAGVGNVGLSRVPFLFNERSGVRTDYDPSDGVFRDINDGGLIAGSATGVGRPSATVGTPGAMKNLSPHGAVESYAHGINNAGLVVGMYFTDPELLTTTAFVATPIPEPATWALLGLGIAAIQLRRHRSAN